MRWLTFLALVAVAAFSALNWRTQRQMQQELDALNATLAERAPAPVAVAQAPQTPAPAELPALAPEPRPVAKEAAPAKSNLPSYIVEAPDVLQIDALRVIPLPGYRLEPLDVLYLSAENDFEGARIAGLYPVDPDGAIDLGPKYGGPVRVADLQTGEAEKAIEKKVRRFAPKAVVSAALAQSRGVKQISGQHIVRPDGTVSLGSYGSVYVAGLSLARVKQAIEAHLSKCLYRPEVAVDVFAFNSKCYYVITDFAGNGEQVTRFPHTGNETVLDAVSQIGGLRGVGSKSVRLVRSGPNGAPDQVLPVKYTEITQLGDTTTNYQLMPGDRLHVTDKAK